jgi:hypothetical protein
LPLAVRRKRFFAPLLVFILGISTSSVQKVATIPRAGDAVKAVAICRPGMPCFFRPGRDVIPREAVVIRPHAAGIKQSLGFPLTIDVNDFLKNRRVSIASGYLLTGQPYDHHKGRC